MKFNADKFDRHLNNIGQDVKWRRSYACTCLNPESGSANPKHARCGGKGYFWDVAIETRIGIARQDTNPNLAVVGQYDTGDMLGVIPRSSAMWAGAGEYDRVIMLNSTDRFSQPLKRGSTTERLIFAVKDITRIFWENSSGDIVEGAIPQVSTNGVLSWAGGVGEPPPGTIYSVSGNKFTEYYIYKHLPSDRNEHAGMALPKRCTLRKFDLFNR